MPYTACSLYAMTILDIDDLPWQYPAHLLTLPARASYKRVWPLTWAALQECCNSAL
jgi:hypothetical protein